MDHIKKPKKINDSFNDFDLKEGHKRFYDESEIEKYKIDKIKGDVDPRDIQNVILFEILRSLKKIERKIKWCLYLD